MEENQDLSFERKVIAILVFLGLIGITVAYFVFPHVYSLIWGIAGVCLLATANSVRRKISGKEAKEISIEKIGAWGGLIVVSVSGYIMYNTTSLEHFGLSALAFAGGVLILLFTGYSVLKEMFKGGTADEDEETLIAKFIAGLAEIREKRADEIKEAVDEARGKNYWKGY